MLKFTLQGIEFANSQLYRTYFKLYCDKIIVITKQLNIRDIGKIIEIKYTGADKSTKYNIPIKQRIDY